MTIFNLINGTSRLPNVRWGHQGNTLAQTQAACASLPLEPQNTSPVQYTSCADVLMGLLDPGVQTAAVDGSWLPTGLLKPVKCSFVGQPNPHYLPPCMIQHYVKGKPILVSQLYDGFHSSKLALDYDWSGNHASHTYSDYFSTYSTASHLYAYDNRLFTGHYMSPAYTRAELSARGIAAPPDPGINRVQWADGWKTGYLFGSRVVYTAGNLYNYQTANLRFPHAGVTVIVMGNTASTDALNVAEHAAAFVLPGKEAGLAAVGAPTSTDLLGAYRRQIRPADKPALNSAWSSDYFVSLNRPLNDHEKLTLTIDRSRFRLGDTEQYSATDSGRLMVFGPPPGLTTQHFCTGQKTDITPTGYYHWTLLGRVLTITRVSDRFCSDRAQLAPGTWIRIDKPAS